MLIYCSRYLIMSLCSDFCSLVVLIFACGLILSWDYFWSMWVLCAVFGGNIFTEKFYIYHGWMSEGFHLSKTNFHSNWSVWDPNTMWIVFIWTPYLGVAQARAWGPITHLMFLCFLSSPLGKSLISLIQRGQGLWRSLCSSIIFPRGSRPHLWFLWGFYDSSTLLLALAAKSAIPQDSGTFAHVLWVPLWFFW